jgi:hypothetical protein
MFAAFKERFWQALPDRHPFSQPGVTRKSRKVVALRSAIRRELPNPTDPGPLSGEVRRRGRWLLDWLNTVELRREEKRCG